MRYAVSSALVTLMLAGGCGPVDPLNNLNNGSVLNNGERLDSTVSGSVTDNRGAALEGATVELFDLAANQSFVEGGDVTAAEAYIDRAAILSSDNSLATATTGSDGKFVFEGVFPSALLAVATKDGCTSGFAGFDEETGVLNLDTLILPDSNLDFAVPTFVLACATPPEDIGPEGNTDEAPPFEPEVTPPTCDEATCTAAGGVCEGADCVLACTSDDDCQAGQPGAWCDLIASPVACRAPAPGEIVPPVEVTAWTSFTLVGADDAVLADASAGNATLGIDSIPETGLAEVRADYDGDAETAFVHVQSGGQECPDLQPRTDHFEVEIVDGKVAGEVYLHGGHQKILVSTSAVLGEGDQTFAIEVGEPCALPRHPFVAIMSWDAGPSEPADLDLNIWSADGELVHIGSKQAGWGQLAREGRQGPGPEVFRASDVSAGPFTIKAQFFSGRPRDIEGKLRLLRIIDGTVRDDSFVFTVSRPKDVAEIGVFESE